MPQYILDSSAIIAFFKDEEGAEKVEQLLMRAYELEISVLMHNASVAEFYYDLLYTLASQDADMILKTLSSYPITFIEFISAELIKLIGYYKTSYKISFADCFVLGTARLNNAKVVTSDHHEFDAIDKSGDVGFEWIR